MSNILQGLGTAVGLTNMGYNMYANHRNRKDYLKQQAYANNFAENAAQIRRKDLEAAGLHPTLAAGNAGVTPPVGSSSHHNVPPASVMEQAVAKAQMDATRADISKTHAETERIRKLTDIDERAMNVNEAHLGLSSNADKRAQDLHPGSIVMQRIEQDLKLAGISNTKAETAVKKLDAAIRKLEHEYMDKNNYKMPTMNPMIQELTTIVERVLIDLPRAVIDYTKYSIIEAFRNRQPSGTPTGHRVQPLEDPEYLGRGRYRVGTVKPK